MGLRNMTVFSNPQHYFMLSFLNSAPKMEKFPSFDKFYGSSSSDQLTSIPSSIVGQDLLAAMYVLRSAHVLKLCPRQKRTLD